MTDPETTGDEQVIADAEQDMTATPALDFVTEMRAKVKRADRVNTIMNVIYVGMMGALIYVLIKVARQNEARDDG